MFQTLNSPDSRNLSNFALYQMSSIVRNKHQTALGHINALVQYILTFIGLQALISGHGVNYAPILHPLGVNMIEGKSMLKKCKPSDC